MPLVRARAAIAAALPFAFRMARACRQRRICQNLRRCAWRWPRQAPLLAIEYGARALAEPFGKPAAEWTQDDLRSLKTAMTECIAQPNRSDLGEERQILSKVAAAVAQAQQAQVDRERQNAATHDLAARQAEARLNVQRERAVQQEECAASHELGAFYGHIMSDAELARARQIKDNIPRLANAVDLLLAFQEKARRTAAEQARDQAERAEASRRIEAERAQHEIEVQRPSRRRKSRPTVDAPRSPRRFRSRARRHGAPIAATRAVPCMTTSCGLLSLPRPATSRPYVRSTRLASKLEIARAASIQCIKDLDRDLDALAREEASRSLDRASDFFGRQKAMRRKMMDLSCE